MNIRAILIAIIAVVWPVSAVAVEQINEFNVAIDVQKDGDIIVTETIAVTAEGAQIRRGIFRDLPRYYTKDGRRLPYNYDVARVTRNGEREPYNVERAGNALRIRIGDADVFLKNGAHIYEIEYEVKNQIRYFDTYDELYWNVTGSYWYFPIETARAVITLPQGARVNQTAAYTGGQGDTGGAYRYSRDGDAHVFETTSPLMRRQGLTVALGFEKGAVDPPSAADRRAEWWTIHASMIVLLSAIALLFLFYLRAYHRVGRDPAKGPVFPRYEPPEGFSPAATHHIYHRRFAGHKALIASLLNLAIKDRLRINAKDKKKTELTLLEEPPASSAYKEEDELVSKIFNSREKFTLGDDYDASFTSAYRNFQKEVGKDFGAPFFKWNSGFLVLGIILSAIAIAVAAKLSIGWTLWHMGLVAALVILSAVFSYFLPAPTDRGQKIRTEIEGFRLYLKTAERLQLNAAKPGTDAPPPMSVERYERFLPFAVALGVEQPWTKHFEKLIPAEAKAYNPHWASLHGGHYNSIGGLNRSLVSSMSSGVASAMPQSSSSSGSGGGGFSGGGGGGGGGGGW
ncbi:DUF2207 domain-containing protein [Hyphococcus sp.]|uniref:DUF2207 domain-containing protein n=1 Tax=Hyphococcus sp. TaxID=2038636 RepID=UPI003CCC0EE4